MNTDASMPDEDREIDELLERARWPEHTPNQVDRVFDSWQRAAASRKETAGKVRRISSRRISRLRVAVFGSLAAAAAIVLGVVTYLAPIESDEGTESVQREQVVAPRLAQSPNPYQQIVYRAARRTRQSQSKRPEHQELDELVQRMLQSPEAKLDAELTKLAEQPGIEARLVERIRVADQGQRAALVRVLSGVASWRSLPALMQLAQNPDLLPHVFPAIVRLSDSRTLTRIGRSEIGVDQKRKILRELLVRGDIVSVRYYLNFLMDPASKEIALQEAGSVEEATTRTLFQLLKDQNYDYRIAAARVLGNLDDPEVAGRLAQLALRGSLQREAIAGLLCCDVRQAKEFVSMAQHTSRLSSMIRSVRNQLVTNYQ